MGGEGGIFSNSLHLVEIGPYRNTTKTLPILNIWKSNITLSSDVYRYCVEYSRYPVQFKQQQQILKLGEVYCRSLVYFQWGVAIYILKNWKKYLHKITGALAECQSCNSPGFEPSTVESEGLQMKQCWVACTIKGKKNMSLSFSFSVFWRKDGKGKNLIFGLPEPVLFQI
jgi:hypothetical protein